jgi:hypothetical protein
LPNDFEKYMKNLHDVYSMLASAFMKGLHLFWLSRSKGMTVDIWIRDYNPPRCFQKKISGRGRHNVNISTTPCHQKE